MEHRHAHLGRRAFTLLELLTVIVILGILAAVAIPVMSALVANSRAAQAKQAASNHHAGAAPTAAPHVATVPSATYHTPPDLTWLWVTLGVVGALAVLAVAALVVYHLVARARRARSSARAALEARTARWGALRARHAELEAAYGEYLFDLAAVLARPALNDVTVPATAAFVEAHAALNAFPADAVPGDEDVVRYDQLVSSAWSSWRAADAHATRAGLGSMTRDEQKRVKQALALLALAADDAASEFERDSALTQAKHLVDGLVVLPPRAVARLEASARRAITA